MAVALSLSLAILPRSVAVELASEGETVTNCTVEGEPAC